MTAVQIAGREYTIRTTPLRIVANGKPAKVFLDLKEHDILIAENTPPAILATRLAYALSIALEHETALIAGPAHHSQPTTKGRRRRTVSGCFQCVLVYPDELDQRWIEAQPRKPAPASASPLPASLVHH